MQYTFILIALFREIGEEFICFRVVVEMNQVLFCLVDLVVNSDFESYF